MRIAYLGWGSLICKPGHLHIEGDWKPDGPLLPVEFARASQDGRLTLVLHPEGREIQTFWNHCTDSDLYSAIDSLMNREKTAHRFIGYVVSDGNKRSSIVPNAAERISAWGQSKGIEAVVWTDLPSNIKEPIEDNAIKHLRGLPKETALEAQKYIMKVPKQITTRFRPSIEAVFNLVVWVADIGSIKNNNFGWSREGYLKTDINSGSKISDFVIGIAKDLSEQKKVAVGFECPLFLPVSGDPVCLTKARQGEGNRSWSAGAGSAALAVGLTECVWIFEQIKSHAHTAIIPTFEWTEFLLGEANLFVWEAFVTAQSKGNNHEADANIAATSFWENYPHIIESSSIHAENPYCMAGAALLRSGLSYDLSQLSKECIVLKG